MFSVFFGPSHKSSKIGARFLAIICLALIGFGSWAGMSEFDKVITAWKVNGVIYNKCRKTNEKYSRYSLS